jgi:NAD+ kinase
MAKKHIKQIKSVGFVVKYNQPQATEFAAQVVAFMLNKGIRVYLSNESSDVVDGLMRALSEVTETDREKIKVIDKARLTSMADMIIVLGGDGTFLGIARLMRTRSIPIVGINMGQLGFLTEIRKEEAFEVLHQILDEKTWTISERPLLEVTLQRKRKIIFKGPVVNDAVISKGAIARIIGIDLAIDGQFLSSVRADGVIVATPTGSTAYSLAAGGPILDPKLKALVISPICPHSLTQRPIVIPDSSQIEMRLMHRPGHVLLTLDGQDAVDMDENDVVKIRRFRKHSLQLISSPERDYFKLLREKFQFGIRT